MHEIVIDGFDAKIIAALQKNGRLTNQELAEKVNLSSSQCSRRRMALEETGIILGYRAELSKPKIGLELTVFVEISMAAHTPEYSDRLVEVFNNLPEVQEAFSLTGEADYFIKLVVKDLKRLSEVLNEVFLPLEGVAKLRSSIVLDHLKETNHLPLEHL